MHFYRKWLASGGGSVSQTPSFCSPENFSIYAAVMMMITIRFIAILTKHVVLAARCNSKAPRLFWGRYPLSARTVNTVSAHALTHRWISLSGLSESQNGSS